jgi:hypothetical protein
MERHLDDRAIRALEAKDAQAVAHFRDHLSRPCAQCEQYLANAPAHLWWLEAEADRLLHIHGALAMPASADAAGFRSVRRAMRARRMRKALAATLAGAVAIAAALLIVLAVPRGGAPGSQDLGIKGQASALLELSAVVVSRSGATSPVSPGGRAHPGDTLVLRYRADQPGVAFLVEESPGGSPKVLGQFALSAGTHDLADSGGVAGVSLEGERGDVHLWLVQSSGPMTAEGALDAVRQPAKVAGASVVGFTVRVAPGEN